MLCEKSNCDLGEEELRREAYVPRSQLTAAVPTAMPVLSFPVLHGNIKNSRYICPWTGEVVTYFQRLIKKSQCFQRPAKDPYFHPGDSGNKVTLLGERMLILYAHKCPTRSDPGAFQAQKSDKPQHTRFGRSQSSLRT